MTEGNARRIDAIEIGISADVSSLKEGLQKAAADVRAWSPPQKTIYINVEPRFAMTKTGKARSTTDQDWRDAVSKQADYIANQMKGQIETLQKRIDKTLEFRAVFSPTKKSVRELTTGTQRLLDEWARDNQGAQKIAITVDVKPDIVSAKNFHGTLQRAVDKQGPILVPIKWVADGKPPAPPSGGSRGGGDTGTSRPKGGKPKGGGGGGAAVDEPMTGTVESRPRRATAQGSTSTGRRAAPAAQAPVQPAPAPAAAPGGRVIERPPTGPQAPSAGGSFADQLTPDAIFRAQRAGKMAEMAAHGLVVDPNKGTFKLTKAGKSAANQEWIRANVLDVMQGKRPGRRVGPAHGGSGSRFFTSGQTGGAMRLAAGARASEAEHAPGYQMDPEEIINRLVGKQNLERFMAAREAAQQPMDPAFAAQFKAAAVYTQPYLDVLSTLEQKKTLSLQDRTDLNNLLRGQPEKIRLTNPLTGISFGEEIQAMHSLARSQWSGFSDLIGSDSKKPLPILTPQGLTGKERKKARPGLLNLIAAAHPGQYFGAVGAKKGIEYQNPETGEVTTRSPGNILAMAGALRGVLGTSDAGTGIRGLVARASAEEDRATREAKRKLDRRRWGKLDKAPEGERLAMLQRMLPDIPASEGFLRRVMMPVNMGGWGPFLRTGKAGSTETDLSEEVMGLHASKEKERDALAQQLHGMEPSELAGFLRGLGDEPNEALGGKPSMELAQKLMGLFPKRVLGGKTGPWSAQRAHLQGLLPNASLNMIATEPDTIRQINEALDQLAPRFPLTMASIGEFGGRLDYRNHRGAGTENMADRWEGRGPVFPWMARRPYSSLNPNIMPNGSPKSLVGFDPDFLSADAEAIREEMFKSEQSNWIVPTKAGGRRMGMGYPAGHEIMHAIANTHGFGDLGSVQGVVSALGLPKPSGYAQSPTNYGHETWAENAMLSEFGEAPDTGSYRSLGDFLNILSGREIEVHDRLPRAMQLKHRELGGEVAGPPRLARDFAGASILAGNGAFHNYYPGQNEFIEGQDFERHLNGDYDASNPRWMSENLWDPNRPNELANDFAGLKYQRKPVLKHALGGRIRGFALGGGIGGPMEMPWEMEEPFPEGNDFGLGAMKKAGLGGKCGVCGKTFATDKGYKAHVSNAYSHYNHYVPEDEGEFNPFLEWDDLHGEAVKPAPSPFLSKPGHPASKKVLPGITFTPLTEPPLDLSTDKAFVSSQLNRTFAMLRGSRCDLCGATIPGSRIDAHKFFAHGDMDRDFQPFLGKMAPGDVPEGFTADPRLFFRKEGRKTSFGQATPQLDSWFTALGYGYGNGIWLPSGPDLGMFHATPAMDKVLAHGLHSKEWQRSHGLPGVGAMGGAPDSTVHQTYSLAKAKEVARGFMMLGMAARGEVPADYVEDFYSAKALGAGFPMPSLFNKPTDPYELARKYDKEFFYSAPANLRLGLFSDRHISEQWRPENIGVVQTAVKKSARPEINRSEMEIAFRDITGRDRNGDERSNIHTLGEVWRPPQRALGGNGRAQPYVVGEAGPEIFVPESAGWIIPHHLMDQLPKRKGGGRVKGGNYDIIGGSWNMEGVKGARSAGDPELYRGTLSGSNVERVFVTNWPTSMFGGGGSVSESGFKSQANQPLTMNQKKNNDDIATKIGKKTKENLGSGPTTGGGDGGGKPKKALARKLSAAEEAEIDIASLMQQFAPGGAKSFLGKSSEATKQAFQQTALRSPSMAIAEGLSVAGPRGGIQERARAVQQQQQLYRSLTSKRAAISEDVEASKVKLVKAVAEGGDEKEIESLTRKIDEGKEALKVYDEAIKPVGQDLMKMTQAVAPVSSKLATAATNIVGAAIGTTAFSAALTVLTTAAAMGAQALGPMVERGLGFVETSNAMAKSLGESTRQAKGFTQIAVSAAEAEAGLGKSAAATIEPLLKQRAAIEAGNTAFSDQIKMINSAYAIRKQQADLEAGGSAGPLQPAGGVLGLTRSTGGWMNTPIGATPSMFEQVAQQMGLSGGQQTIHDWTGSFFGGAPGPLGQFVRDITGSNQLMTPDQMLSNNQGRATSTMTMAGQPGEDWFKDGLGKWVAERVDAATGTQTINKVGEGIFLPGADMGEKVSTLMAPGPWEGLDDQSRSAVSQMAAFSLTIDDLSDAAKRGNASTNVLRKGMDGYTDAIQEQSDQVLKKIGVDQKQIDAFHEWGIAFANFDKDGKVAAKSLSSQDMKGFYASANAGLAKPDAQFLLQQMTATTIPAAVRDIQRQSAYQIGVQQPAEFALNRIANPVLPYAQDPRLGASQQVLKGPQFKDLFQQDQKAAKAFAAEYGKDMGKAQAITNAQFEKGNSLLKQMGIPDSMISDLGMLGGKILEINTGLQQKQTNLAVADYTNQIRLANRALGDAKDMWAAIHGNVKNTLGGLEGQNIALSRTLQLLGFELQQRQINFQLATAGFVAPGQTPEEIAARIKEAKIEADYAQRMLDLQKKIAANQYKTTGMGIGRQMTDARAAKHLAEAGRHLVQETNAAQAALERLNAARDVILGQAQTMLSQGISLDQQKIGLLKEFESQIGTISAENVKAINKAFQAATGGYAEYIDGVIDSINNINALVPGSSKQSGGETLAQRERRTGEDLNGNGKIGAASGFLGQVSSLTDFTVGEAGGEAVAVLKNPRAMAIGASRAGGGSPVYVIFNNPVVKEEGDIDAIVRKVTAVMQRTTAMYGLRKPA